MMTTEKIRTQKELHDDLSAFKITHRGLSFDLYAKPEAKRYMILLRRDDFLKEITKLDYDDLIKRNKAEKVIE